MIQFMAAAELFVTVHDSTTGPVVRRSWRLAAGPDGAILTGLFGFPWRDRRVQAKCVATDPAGRADPFGAMRLDRSHQFVPSPDCRCGLYATNDPRPGWLQRRFLRHQIVVSGFVRLSGRVLRQGDEYRAAEATVVGPLVISLPAPGVLRRRAAPLGVRQQPARIVVDGGSFAVRYGRRGRGLPLGDWLRDVNATLRRRYGVEVIGLIPQ
jgi:hypothetical protein